VLILGFVDDYYFLGDAVDCAAAYRRDGPLPGSHNTIPTGSSATATAMLQGRSVGFVSGPGYDWVEAASWSIGSGGAVAQPTCFYDGDSNGIVNVDDLLGLLSEFGRGC
jgi:hypothetical protein